MTGEEAATAATARPSWSPGIERSLVPKAMVVTASITCDRPKNRMNDSISGSLARSSRGTKR